MRAPRAAGAGEARPLVLVTGSTGAIGSRLRAALSDTCDVVGMDLKCDGAEGPCIEVDLSSRESVDRALARLAERHGRHLASVIHLAAYFDLTGEENPLYEAVNVEGTRNLLRGLRGLQVDQFVYASTMLVHAPTEPGLPLDEDAPLEPKWAYPRSKAAAEAVVREERGGIPAILLRIAGMYTDDCGSPFLAHQIRRIYERRLTGSVYAGDAARGQAFIHIEDLVDLVGRAVARRGSLPAEVALLAGEPTVMTYEALQNRLADLLHGEEGWRTVEMPRPLAMAGAWLQQKMEPLVPDAIDRGEAPFIRPFMAAISEDHYEIDISRARSLLGWEPRHRLRDALPRMVEALKADPAAWYRRYDMAPPAWLSTADEEKLEPDRIHAEYERVRRRAHYDTQWAHFVNMGLGAWLLGSPATLGYGDRAMVVSDIASGATLIVLAAIALSWRMGWARVACAVLGVWLMSAPLLFWATDAAAYLNGSLVGALVVGFAVAVGPTPGIGPIALVTGPDRPQGWDYSPSDWTQRVPIIALAFVGLLISRYLAAYQLGHLDAVWDPFFPDGTRRVITSEVSRAWPVPDAGVGALTYLLEIVTGVIGGRARWRTMPWLVLLFGIMIVPLGAVSIYFIIIQPIVIGTWCTLCLVAAAAMLLQIPYSYDEVCATLQFLAERRRKGKSLLRVLLFGDTAQGDGRSPRDEFAAPPGSAVRDMLGGGVGLPWTLLASAAIGLWMMCTRLVFGTTGAQADSDHLLGAVAVTVAIAALAELGRPLRLANVLVGVAMMGAPWMLDGGGPLADWTGVLAGALLVGLSIPRGRVRCSYGPWDRYIL